MAQILRKNIPLIHNFSGTIFVPDFVKDLLEHLDHLSDSFSRLDNKDRSNSDPPTREDVVAVLRTIDRQLQLQDCTMEGLNMASALFMLSVHLLVPNTLMRNPEEYAEKARRTLANQAFKDQSLCRMQDFVLNSMTKCRRPVWGGSIWDAADEDDKQPGPSSWDDGEESDGSDNRCLPHGGGKVGNHHNSRAKRLQQRTQSSDKEQQGPSRACAMSRTSKSTEKQQKRRNFH